MAADPNAPPPNPNVNPDGIRRYEELVRDIRKVAENALSIAIANSVLGHEGILDIVHGGTGTNYKSWVDNYSNQFDLHGAKIWHDPHGFQKESDVVDSGELAGNIRLITCDPQAADIGPQMRFSGRNTDNDATAFAFATLAGRKFNSISGDMGGYFQIAVTNSAGVIVEAARVDHEQNMGIGTTIPVKGAGNRLHVSGGDILLDAEGGTRSVKVAIHGVYGRLQAVYGFDEGGSGTSVSAGGGQHEHLFLSTNVRFSPENQCFIDDDLKGTAAVQLKSFYDSHGEVRIWIGDADGNCPIIRGVFHDTGLDVAGNVIATGEVVAGGVLNVAGGTGNCNPAAPGRVTGDNFHFGTGSPEGVVCAPVGAIFSRNDPGTTSEILYAKSANDYGPTGWIPMPLGNLNTVCVSALCPDPTSCPIWFDFGGPDSTNMLWIWYPDARLISGSPAGAWLSADVFTVNQKIPIGERPGGGSFAMDYRGVANKHYVYFTPTHFGWNRRHSSGKFDIYLQDLVATLRVQDNGNDPDKHYYTFDLVTLENRQGDPREGLAKQEWPGDRASDEPPSDQIKGLGHTFHPSLPTSPRAGIPESISLVERGLPNAGPWVTPNAAVWRGTVIGGSTATKVMFDVSSTVADVGITGYAPDGINPTGPTPIPISAASGGQWKQNLNRETVSGLPLNDGYIIHVLTATDPLNVDVERWILDNDTSYMHIRKSFNSPLVAGDTFEVYSTQYKRVLARVSTRGNVWYPSGPYSNNATKNIQDFVETGSYATTFRANNAGGSSPDPALFCQQVVMNYYLPLVTDAGFQTGLNAVILAGLWDSVRQPGKLAGSINVTYRVALPPTSGSPCI